MSLSHQNVDEVMELGAPYFSKAAALDSEELDRGYLQPLDMDAVVGHSYVASPQGLGQGGEARYGVGVGASQAAVRENYDSASVSASVSVSASALPTLQAPNSAILPSSTSPSFGPHSYSSSPAPRSLSPRSRVAPRSKNLFRVGPPFGATVQASPLFSHKNNTQITPRLSARLDRGFERGEAGNWIGYKRNYLTLVSAFEVPGCDLDSFLAQTYYVVKGARRMPVRYFALGVSARCSDATCAVSLVQHTPKRDKGPQYAVPIYAAVPGTLPDHKTVTLACNKRNRAKVDALDRVFSYRRATGSTSTEDPMHPQDLYSVNSSGSVSGNSISESVSGNSISGNSISESISGSVSGSASESVSESVSGKSDPPALRHYPPDVVRVARFERIQFSASLRVKSTPVPQKYYTLTVKLLAVVADANPVVIASVESDPLLVRGRSPSSYAREKTSGFRG
ncbi:hypothetical protein CLUG_00404 [Clavispora lusitaniae ATCC 42720]|uniref:NDT80 domain-containing protein n=1 Tax=Clavispora lusitaniae (strain ATCC 42720) TaxID=306902 RepID=C4XWT1_CLAL4|nr:uncharacterized protein CLUG_00404 [Clavispora lusitaniae ATCC 42720]EEQ36281.1 hypothetical protein CLUG_00404 [Clavispora lusitaniae ATCC 42720]